jgi:hypothetical protein
VPSVRPVPATESPACRTLVVRVAGGRTDLARVVSICGRRGLRITRLAYDGSVAIVDVEGPHRLVGRADRWLRQPVGVLAVAEG